MKRIKSAVGGPIPAAGETARQAAISARSIHNAAPSRKSDPGLHGPVLEIAATPTAELCEQIRLLEGITEEHWFAAARRRHLALAEVRRRLVVPR